MLHNERGSTLLTAILIFSIVLIFGSVLLARGEYSMTETASDIAAERARYASKSGLDAAIYWLNNGKETNGTKVINNVVTDISKYANTSNKISNLADGSECIVQITRPDPSEVPAGASTDDYLLITSIGKSKYTSAITKTVSTVAPTPTPSSEPLVKEYTSKALVKIKRGGGLFTNGAAFASRNIDVAGDTGKELTLIGNFISGGGSTIKFVNVKKNEVTGEGGVALMYSHTGLITNLNAVQMHLMSNATIREVHHGKIDIVTAKKTETVSVGWSKGNPPDVPDTITVDNSFPDTVEELNEYMNWNTEVDEESLLAAGYSVSNRRGGYVEFTKIVGDTKYYAVTPNGAADFYKIVDHMGGNDTNVTYAIGDQIAADTSGSTKHKFFFCNADESEEAKEDCKIEFEIQQTYGTDVSIYLYSPNKEVHFNRALPAYLKGGIIVGNMTGGSILANNPTIEYESGEQGLPMGSGVGAILGCDVIEYK